MSRSTGCTTIIQLSIVVSMLFINKVSNLEEKNSTMACDEARLKCAYRTGCGHALQFYLTQCASVLDGDSQECPESCQHALIALTSTDEGKELMTCNCAFDDGICKNSKQRVEVCRSSVMTAMNNTNISCRIATWICHADTECSTALSYYNFYCKSMFIGKKCTHRCKNSISILRRQEKAQKLNECICDGEEERDCRKIHRNMNVLCHKKNGKLDGIDSKTTNGNVQTNEILKDCSKIENSGVRTKIDKKLLSCLIILFLLLVTKD